MGGAYLCACVRVRVCVCVCVCWRAGHGIGVRMGTRKSACLTTFRTLRFIDEHADPHRCARKTEEHVETHQNSLGSFTALKRTYPHRAFVLQQSP